MATRILPTFLLKGIDPAKVLADYQAGKFTRPIEPKGAIRIANNIAILAPTYGSSPADPIYTIKDRNNNSVVFASSGHSNFEVFTTSGGVLPEGGRCEHCRDDFEHTVVGYPIAYKESTVLETVGEESRYKVLYTFWIEGRFCSFECALGYVRITMRRPTDFRDTSMRDSERMLKGLFRLTYPEAPVLRPAQDHRLLKSNGGSLTREEWQDNRHIYVRTDRVLMIPAKVEYIQQNFVNPHITLTDAGYAREWA